MTTKKPKPPPPWLSGFCGADLPDESHARCRGAAGDSPCVCPREGVHSTPHINDPAQQPEPPPTLSGELKVDGLTLTGVDVAGNSIYRGNTISLPELEPHLTVDGVRYDDALDAIRNRDGHDLATLGQLLADGLLHPPPDHPNVAPASYAEGWRDALTWAIRGLMYGRPKETATDG